MLPTPGLNKCQTSFTNLFLPPCIQNMVLKKYRTPNNINSVRRLDPDFNDVTVLHVQVSWSLIMCDP